MGQTEEKTRKDSQVELISANSAVITAFALTRATMATVILGTLFLSGLSSASPALFMIQVGVAAAAVLAIGISALSLLQKVRGDGIPVKKAWSLILLDSILAIGVMSVIDAETSPLAWVALITPVLETAVLFSISGAGFVWLGLSLAFLALRLTTTASDNATTETLVLSLQQVLAVLYVAGPAALMSDSAQQRIDSLAEARRSAD